MDALPINEKPPLAGEGGFRKAFTGLNYHCNGTQSIGKLPIEAESERAVLIASMQDETARGKFFSELKPNHFFVEKHRLLFHTMGDLWTRHGNFDLSSLTAALNSIDALEKVGGAHEVTSLATDPYLPSMTDHHISTLSQAQASRQLLKTTQASVNALESGGDFAAVIGELKTDLEKIEATGGDRPNGLKLALVDDSQLRALAIGSSALIMESSLGGVALVKVGWQWAWQGRFLKVETSARMRSPNPSAFCILTVKCRLMTTGIVLTLSPRGRACFSQCRTSRCLI